MFKISLMQALSNFSNIGSVTVFNNVTSLQTTDRSVQFCRYLDGNLTFVSPKALMVRVIDKKSQYTKGAKWTMFSLSLMETMRLLNFNYEKGPQTIKVKSAEKQITVALVSPKSQIQARSQTRIQTSQLYLFQLQREGDTIDFQLSEQQMNSLKRTTNSGLMELYGLEQYYDQYRTLLVEDMINGRIEENPAEMAKKTKQKKSIKTKQENDDDQDETDPDQFIM